MWELARLSIMALDKVRVRFIFLSISRRSNMPALEVMQPPVKEAVILLPDRGENEKEVELQFVM